MACDHNTHFKTQRTYVENATTRDFIMQITRIKYHAP